MEGVAVYLNYIDEPTLIMYKEYSNNNVFFATFCNKKLQYQFITTKCLTEIMPKECIHIITKLPFNRNINIMLDMWKILIKNSLIYLST